MTTYIALLRGINVGGNHRIKMAELREMIEAMGLKAPETLLQSGNVVFQAEGGAGRDLETRLEEATMARFGFRPAYFVRAADEWQGLVDGNPFPREAEEDPSHMVVTLLKEAPDRDEVATVAEAIKGPERLAAGSGHVYMVFPMGIGTSKVDRTPGYSRLLGLGTMRNWNTVKKLHAMVRAR